MRTIMVLNTKGGTGKTTIVTNIAGYYADQAINVCIKDYDSQASSLDWLAQRDISLPEIHGLAAFKPSPQFTTRTWQMRLPEKTKRVVLDTPAGIDLSRFSRELSRVDKLLIPVSSSAIDIRSTIRFIQKLQKQVKASGGKADIGVVANRVNVESSSYVALQKVFAEIEVSFIASLSCDDIYLKSSECGEGVLEMSHSTLARDKFEWAPLINWLEDEQRLPQTLNERKLYVVSE